MASNNGQAANNEPLPTDGKQGAIEVVRPDYLTRFQPGRSGNPSGRPAVDQLTLAARSDLTREDAHRIVEVLIRRAKAGDLKAIALLWDRLGGKAVARVEAGEPGDFAGIKVIRNVDLSKL